MTNNDSLNMREVLGYLKRYFIRLNKDDKSKASQAMSTRIAYAFFAVVLSALLMWVFSPNTWVLLISGALIGVSLFSKNEIVNKMYKFVSTSVVALILVGFLYNILITRTGLTDNLESYQKDKVLAIGIDMEHPEVNLHGEAYKLVRVKAEELRRRDAGNFPKLLEDAAIIQRMKDSVYNSLHGIKFPAQPANGNQAYQPKPTGQSLQPRQFINIDKFKKQNGSTLIYQFTLGENDSTSRINLYEGDVDHGYSLDYTDDITIVDANGNERVFYHGGKASLSTLNFSLKGIAGKTSMINLKIWPKSV